MKIEKVLYFGNPYIQEDNLVIKIIEKLDKIPNIKFFYVKNVFQLVDMDFKNTVILDVADNIKKTILLGTKDIKKIKRTTAHDFDLGFFLRLTKQKVKIIAIPKEYDENKAIEEVTKLLENNIES